MSWFDKLSQAKVRRVLNVLIEAPFFYREDDEELFAFLRKNRAAFQRFYEELYGWTFVVDGRCARVYKTTWHNRALKPSQHDVFDPTRRDDCLAFLLALEFYEHLLDERNVSVDDPEPLRFELGELYGFARGRLVEELGEGAPDEEGVRRLLRGLVPVLLRYRFLRELVPDREDRDRIEGDQVLYECMPAFSHYDLRALGAGGIGEIFGAGEGDGEVGAERSSEVPE